MKLLLDRGPSSRLFLNQFMQIVSEEVPQEGKSVKLILSLSSQTVIHSAGLTVYLGLYRYAAITAGVQSVLPVFNLANWKV